jgi:hypothetical protein
MSQLHLGDEILMAFADGELDESMASAVEQAMLADPSVARRITDFMRSRRLTRSAFFRGGSLEVPSDLRAAVLAQIDAAEAVGSQPAKPVPPQNPPAAARRGTWSSLKWPLAASFAALTIAFASYFAGQQQARPAHPAGLIAQLGDSPVQEALSTVPSGQDVTLPVGRMRVISTYRLATGSICREFRLQATSGAATAVACRDDAWNVTFALANAESSAYTPSGGGDLVASYLEDLGAGAPLSDAAEVGALAGGSR